MFARIASVLPDKGRFFVQTMVFGPNMIPEDKIDLDALRGTREPGSIGWHQLAAGRLAGLGMRLLYGVRYTDMCAFRAIRRDLLLGLGLREMTYGWNIEMQMRAARAGLRIREVPVSYRRRTGGTSKVAGSLSGSLRAAARIVATFARVSSRPVTARDFSARERDA